jgi:hypothetical protein
MEKCKRCESPEYIRGLCVRHHGQCQSLIARKVTSWDELEELGLISPRKWFRTINGTTDMYLALEEARKKRGDFNWCGDFI